jgi:hypothetical protein
MDNQRTISSLQSLQEARSALKQRIHEQEVELLGRLRSLPKDAAGAVFKAAVPPLLQTAGASLAAKAGLGVAAAWMGGKVMRKTGLGNTLLKQAGMVAGTQLVSFLLRKWVKK